MKTTVAIIAAGLTFGSSARGDPLWDCSPNLSSLDHAAISDTGGIQPEPRPPLGSQEIATPFCFSTTVSIDAVSWVGCYYQSDEAPALARFHIRFFEELGSGSFARPAATPLYDAFTFAEVSPVGWVQSRRIYAFTCTPGYFAPLLVLPDTRLWISVVEDDSSTPFAFRWFESTQPLDTAQNAYRWGDSGLWNVPYSVCPGYNFSLEGHILPDVPEPTSVTLGITCITLGILTTYGRKKGIIIDGDMPATCR